MGINGESEREREKDAKIGQDKNEVHLVNSEDRKDYQTLKLEEYSMEEKIEKNSKSVVQR